MRIPRRPRVPADGAHSRARRRRSAHTEIESGSAAGPCTACNSIVGLQGDYRDEVGGSGPAGAECSAPHEHAHPDTGHCYLFLGGDAGPPGDPYAYQERWTDARARCSDWGGDLAAVSSSDEQLFLTAFVEEHTWTGGTDVTAEGDFEWVNGEPWWENWDEGYPRDPGESGDFDCVALGNDALKFQDTACNATRWVLCERAPGE